MMASRVRWLDGVRYEDLMTVLPPYPVSDGVARNSFMPISMQVSPTANLNIDNATIEFGYAENGDPNGFYCTSRQEACVAAGSAINLAQPFYYQSEPYKGVPCATSCTITIPALPQHVLYFRINFRDALGNILGTSSNQVSVVQ